MNFQNRLHCWVLTLVALTHIFSLFCVIHKKILLPSDEVVITTALVGEPVYDFALKKREQGTQGSDAGVSNIGELILSEPPGIQVPPPELPLELTIDNPSTEAERYFRFEELSTSAVPLSDFIIPIKAALPTRINARVEVYVGRDGMVQVVKVLLINIPSFTEDLKKAIFAARFTPATRNGFPVNSVKAMELSISF